MRQIFGKWCFVMIVIIFVLTPLTVNAAESLEINFFYSKTCPHCAKEEVFLPTLEAEYGSRIKINKYEISSSKNQEIFLDFINNSGRNINGVPATFIGDEVIVGYLSDTTTGEQIKKLIDENLESVTQEDKELAVQLPIFGEVNLMKYSLFGMTAIIAAIDGFNPCAMWVLVVLVSMIGFPPLWLSVRGLCGTKSVRVLGEHDDGLCPNVLM
jgi:thiol-disulfide isomerase/thioredoxin